MIFSFLTVHWKNDTRCSTSDIIIFVSPQKLSIQTSWVTKVLSSFFGLLDVWSSKWLLEQLHFLFERHISTDEVFYFIDIGQLRQWPASIALLVIWKAFVNKSAPPLTRQIVLEAYGSNIDTWCCSYSLLK